MARQGALEGLKVVDFGHYIAGPLLAMLLADAGAEVVHVDPPGGPRWDDPANAVLQRGKRSVQLDLKGTDGGRAALALVSERRAGGELSPA
jgi:crotonobetainyl-CoA:carnitine CoA-transferase CaiB-like acyl-CoA transferase